MLKTLLILIYSALSYSLTWGAQSWNVKFFDLIRGGQEDCWGFYKDGHEYALSCKSPTPVNGIALKVVDVTNPSVSIVVAEVPTVAYDMKDVDVWGNYAYAVNQFGPIQIIDLSYLPNFPESVRTVNNFLNENIQGAHTIFIKDGFAYVSMNGSPPYDLRILDLSDPILPVEVGHYAHPEEDSLRADAHDAYAYGNRLYVANLAGGVSILDISDKSNPVLLKIHHYEGNFTHNVWTTDDGKYLLTTDEDVGGHVKIWDITDLNNIELASEYNSNTGAIVHNVYVKGNLAYMSYYTSGLRVIDITDPTQPEEVGYFDTNPIGGAQFEGAWSAYPFSPSGLVFVSDMGTGLWILKLEVIGGDYDADSSITFLDIIFLVNHLFKNGPAPVPKKAGDVNSDCKVNLGDVIYLVNYLFKEGNPPTPACF